VAAGLGGVAGRVRRQARNVVASTMTTLRHGLCLEVRVSGRRAIGLRCIRRAAMTVHYGAGLSSRRLRGQGGGRRRGRLHGEGFPVRVGARGSAR